MPSRDIKENKRGDKMERKKNRREHGPVKRRYFYKLP
jgi:hypothetical protein